MSVASETFRIADAVIAEQTHLTIPSRVDCIEQTVMLLQSRAESVGVVNNANQSHIVCALTEAITNAIVHGNLEISSDLKELRGGAFARALAERSADPHYADRQVDIRTVYDGTQYIWTVTDQGPGFDFRAILNRLESDDPRIALSSGRGILLMRAFLSEVNWCKGGREIRLCLQRDHVVENRKSPRQNCMAPVRIMPLGNDGAVDWHAAFDAVAVNLSSGGMGVIQSEVRHATRLVIEMMIEGRPVYVPATVCHAHTISPGMAQIGCRFADPQAAAGKQLSDSLQQLIDRILADLDASPNRSDDRRAYQRAPYTQNLQVFIGDPAAPRAVVARDLSRQGLCFISEFELKRGSEITLQMPAIDGTPIRVLCRVARCHHVTGGFHDIGVEFLGAA